jgi:parvulin-like peptidyl-prolyl isomerase
VFPGGRRFRLRRVAQLEESFGPELARTVAALEVGAWARTSSRFGVHLVRVDRRTTARAPSFEDARADVHDALVREARDAAVADAVAALRTRWEIVRR